MYPSGAESHGRTMLSIPVRKRQRLSMVWSHDHPHFFGCFFFLPKEMPSQLVVPNTLNRLNSTDFWIGKEESSFSSWTKTSLFFFVFFFTSNFTYVYELLLVVVVSVVQSSSQFHTLFCKPQRFVGSTTNWITGGFYRKTRFISNKTQDKNLPQ